MLDWNVLSASCKGKIYLQEDSGYSENLFTFNGHFQKKPIAVLVAESNEDIVQAVLFAQQNQIRISVLNGGHSTVGSGLNENGLVVSMRKIKTITPNWKENSVEIGAGALAHEIDAALNPNLKAIPLGDCPVVGIAGLTLGGGNGFLSRSLGLTCDHLLEAELINMRGEVLVCNKTSNTSLYRALQGAGQGNFGIVTSLKFRLSDIPAQVVGGNICWHLNHAEEILPLYDKMLQDAPEALNLYLRINQEMGPIIKIYGMYNGDSEIGMSYFQTMLQWAEPVFHNIGTYSYTEMQQINASTIVEGPCFQWKNGLIQGNIAAEVIQILLDAYSKCPTPYCRINLDTLSGKIQHPDHAEIAFAHRDANFILSIMGVWFEDQERYGATQWVNETYQKLQPFLNGFLYPNYADPAENNISVKYYGTGATEIEHLSKLHNPDGLLYGTLNAEPVDFS
ncbi:MAG: FAD-dependent oxidoreductase [Bacteroidetes bacterium]|nr:FAD-dependent oxidoreductase [Bacteroidota bacterium]